MNTTPQELSTFEAIRKHSPMYVGGKGEWGLHNLFEFLLDYAIAEVMAGRCTQIAVTLEDNCKTITLEDNGRGLPPLVLDDFTNWPQAEKFDESMGYGPETLRSKFFYFWGVHCAAALSRVFHLQVRREGIHYERTFRDGCSRESTTRPCAIHQAGNWMRYSMDPQFFNPGIVFNDTLLEERLRELAFLNPHLTVNFHNKPQEVHDSYRYKNGIIDGVSMLTAGHQPLLPPSPFFCAGAFERVDVEVAFQYTHRDDLRVISYVNCDRMDEGGTQLTGFYMALSRTLLHWGRKNGVLAPGQGRIYSCRLRRGLTAIVSVRLPDARFEVSTKMRLVNPVAQTAVFRILSTALRNYLQAHPELARAIVQRVLEPSPLNLYLV